jgi:flagellar basal-body rod protein FlgG
MMKRSLCLCLLLLSACQTAVPAETLVGYRDAAFRRDPVAVPVAPRIIDDVAAELLRAGAAVHAAEQRVHCENIANVDTIGYKRRVVVVETQQVAGQGEIQFTLPNVIAVTPVFTQGRMQATERSLDVAIDGDGFFSVVLSDGMTGYTRNGRLTVDADGRLLVGVSRDGPGSSGHVLIPQVTIPSDTLDLVVDSEGRVHGRTAGSPDTTTHFGQLNIHRFMNTGGMLADRWVWRPTDLSGQPTTGAPGHNGLGTLKKGFHERSNVDLSAELVALQVLESKRAALLQVMRSYGIEMP